MASNISEADITSGGARIDREEMNIWDLFRRRSKWLLYGAVFGAGLGCLYGVFGSQYYETKAEVLVIRKSPNLPARAANATTEVESDVTLNLLSTHVEILKSPRVVQAGLKRHGLETLASIEKKRYSFETPTDYVIRKMKVVRGGVDVIDESANTVRASLKHTSAEDSQKILSAVVESYFDFVSATFQDVSSDAVRLIEQAKTDLETDVERAEADYIKFLKDAPLHWSGELSASGDKRPSIPQQRLEKVEEKLAEVRVRYIETTTKLAVIEKALAESKTESVQRDFALAMLDSQSLQRLNFFADITRGDPTRSESFQVEQSLRQEAIRAEYEKQLGIRLEAESINLKFGKNHWKTKELERQMASMNQFLTEHSPGAGRELKDSVPAGDVLAAYVQMLRTDALDLKKRQQEYEELSRADIASAKEVVNFEVRGEMLRQELERKRKLHELVIDRLREMNLMRQYGGVVTELITPVENAKLKWLGVVEVSQWVAVLLSMAAGGFVGCCMGAVCGVFRHLTDNTFGSDSEVESALGLPVLGHVDQDNDLPPKMQNAAGSSSDSAITACRSPISQSAEAYRQTRNSLLLLQSRREFKVLQISDVTSGENHAVLAANLAVVFAQAGQNTLLIDCDLRNRGVSRLWGLSEGPGIVDGIRGENDWRQLIHNTDVPGLGVLAAGRGKSGQNDFVVSEKFSRLIDAARSEFDIVILSSPSVLGSSESMAIAIHADLVVLSLRVTRGKRAAALLARDTLAKFGARLAGVVITGADDKSVFGYSDLPRALAGLLEGCPVAPAVG